MEVLRFLKPDEFFNSTQKRFKQGISPCKTKYDYRPNPKLYGLCFAVEMTLLFLLGEGKKGGRAQSALPPFFPGND